MALYIPHSFFHLERLLYVRPETSEPYYVNNLPISWQGVLCTSYLGGGLHSSSAAEEKHVN